MTVMHSCRSLLLAILLCGALTGCAIPVARPLSDGQLFVLGPGPGFSPTTPPPDWVAERPAHRGPVLSVAGVDGVLALQARFVADGQPSVLGRRVNAPLLSTPYLRWGWWMDAPAVPIGNDLPLRLLVTFHGGDPARPSYSAEAPRWLGARRPPFDRAVELVWSEGSRAATPRTVPARYPVRSGHGGLRQWVLESVDLSAIYQQLWPGDDIGRARVMFIGISFAASPRPTTAAVAEIALAR
jgi:hypothetical protein